MSVRDLGNPLGNPLGLLRNGGAHAVGDIVLADSAPGENYIPADGQRYAAALYPALIKAVPRVRDLGDWTQRTLPVSAPWSSVTYGDGLFVAVTTGNTTTAATSPDGINWTQRTLPVSAPWRSVTYGDGLFVAVASGITTTAATCSRDGDIVSPNLRWLGNYYIKAKN